jgi:hypothetical protein
MISFPCLPLLLLLLHYPPSLSPSPPPALAPAPHLPRPSLFPRPSDLDYGKFHSGEYPYLYWEPSDQATLQGVSDSYLRHKLHPEGLRFAINIDIGSSFLFLLKKSFFSFSSPSFSCVRVLASSSHFHHPCLSTIHCLHCNENWFGLELSNCRWRLHNSKNGYPAFK